MSDLISRQAAIDELNDSAELLRRVLDDTDVVGTERAKYEWGLGLIESHISDMEELPSAQQWMPCSEGLPKDGEEVFVYLWQSPYIAWVEANRWYTEDFEVERENEPVAWMPLPEPYKGEEHEIH